MPLTGIYPNSSIWQNLITKNFELPTKSLRVPELLSRALKYGPEVIGLMCYSVEETEFLSQNGFDNFLIAYPTFQQKDLLTLRQMHQAGKSVSLVIDQVEGLDKIAGVMAKCREPFPLVIEFDVSTRLLFGLIHWGVRRSPVRKGKDLFELVRQITNRPELKFQGVMAYEAQVAGLQDKNPFKPLLNPIAHLIRKNAANSSAKVRRELFEIAKERGLNFEIFNGGGTGSIDFSVREECLNEVTVGSGLLCSHLFDYYSNLDLEPACYFALEAVRSSDPRYFTCQGGGYIASGASGPDRLPVPVYPEGLRLTPTEGCGEVRDAFAIAPRGKIGLGGPVLFRHAKAGELAERFKEYLLVSNGKLVGRAKTYRGFGQCFF